MRGISVDQDDLPLRWSMTFFMNIDGNAKPFEATLLEKRS